MLVLVLDALLTPANLRPAVSTPRLDVPVRILGPMTGAWRTLVTPPLSGAANMAMDHALMARARRTGERVLRVYTWSTPTLSLGRHQLARGRVNAEAAKSLGVALVRRPTGGRALLHHREVTYSVTAALGRDDSVRAWYAAINEIIVGALRSLGVDAEPAVVEGRTPAPGSGSCFVRADEGEISVDGRKLVGSALLRQEDALLQHGSILIDDDQQLLADLLPVGEVPPSPAGTLRQALGRAPSPENVALALVNALADAGAETRSLEVDAQLLADFADAERIYASDDWTYKY
jgi:lipoate-protein ligase A